MEKQYRDLVLPHDIPGSEYMGANLKTKVKFCGKEVRLYPFFKLVRPENVFFDDYCKVFDYVYMDGGKGIKIGKHSVITWQVIIEGGANTVIGDRVFIGPGSKLITGTYEFNGCFACEYLPDGTHKNRYGNIVIEDDAYIGANCIIMPGTIIHEGAVLGAGAFAKGELEPWTIYVGTPCKPIGKRVPPTDEQRAIVNQEIDWKKNF